MVAGGSGGRTAWRPGLRSRALGRGGLLDPLLPPATSCRAAAFHLGRGSQEIAGGLGTDRAQPPATSRTSRRPAWNVHSRGGWLAGDSALGGGSDVAQAEPPYRATAEYADIRATGMME